MTCSFVKRVRRPARCYDAPEISKICDSDAARAAGCSGPESSVRSRTNACNVGSKLLPQDNRALVRSSDFPVLFKQVSVVTFVLGQQSTRPILNAVVTLHRDRDCIVTTQQSWDSVSESTFYFTARASTAICEERAAAPELWSAYAGTKAKTTQQATSSRRTRLCMASKLVIR